MTAERTDRDGDDLLGAYVVGALDDDERRQVEARLAVDGGARDQVERLEQGLDVLITAVTAGASPSPDLWDRIAAALPGEGDAGAQNRDVVGDVDQDDRAADGGTGPISSTPTASLADRRTRPLPRPMIAALAAAAALVLVLVGGAAAIQAGRSYDSVPAAAQAAIARGASHGTLRDDDGRDAARVVAATDGMLYVLPVSLPDDGGDRTNQLWSLDTGRPVSLGVLGSDAVALPAPAGAPPRRLAVTREPAGGSPAPTTAPFATGTIA